ncbi:hypothetical protein [Mesonia aquimarina]|uniref:hypothetical protein n=1 Tax=Mesonia aquimarina TaxID=1504967 RepID=UPI000EF5BAD6|nr:hypothetical protein [Mesonia aquimarina]
MPGFIFMPNVSGGGNTQNTNKIAYGKFIVFKKEGNNNQEAIEQGDIVKGISENIFFEGIYKGGDPLEVTEANYQFIVKDQID